MADLVPIFAEVLQPLPPASTKRYFAIVIEAREEAALGGLLSASTNLGNHLRDRQAELLPAGARITRSIEITQELATRAW